MSQVGIVSVGASGGATSFVENVGAAAPVAGVLNIVGGAGITTSGAGNTVTISAIGAGFTWNVVAGNVQGLVAENGYINGFAGLTVFTLPSVAAVGDTFQILGQGAGGWRIDQNAGQTMFIGAASTTAGVLGSVASANRRDCIELVCSTANTEFTAVDWVGTLTVL